MASRGPIVNEGASLLGFEECRNIRLADFHFERRGHTIHGLDALTFEVLGMLVEINKAWGNHQPSRGNHPLAIERVGRDSHDLALGNADIANCIQAGLGIEHPTPRRSRDRRFEKRPAKAKGLPPGRACATSLGELRNRMVSV